MKIDKTMLIGELIQMDELIPSIAYGSRHALPWLPRIPGRVPGGGPAWFTTLTVTIWFPR